MLRPSTRFAEAFFPWKKQSACSAVKQALSFDALRQTDYFE
jgi:hypothetical protein